MVIMELTGLFLRPIIDGNNNNSHFESFCQFLCHISHYEYIQKDISLHLKFSQNIKKKIVKKIAPLGGQHYYNFAW